MSFQTRMADSVYLPGLAIPHSEASPAPRHSAMVRITHWISVVSFIGLVVSGIGILLAHPRFYWGETGGVGTPSIFDLPLPFMLGGPSGWGRYLHFESAWLCVLNGLVYVVSGLVSRHFQKDLALGGSRFTWRFDNDAHRYNGVQRLSYLAVIFVVLPLMIWTGLAMSPAVTSVFPALVNVLGGHQCARTIHFFTGVALVLFVFVHIGMVWRAGFRSRVGAMITGRAAAQKDGL
ncbi:MAG TPA: cytochrome b/b6 domain-containing protein [Bryobacteraceae bacterium]|nr:cytochrome b/b6 domain-containing protein [Bryobacteraceae bacterium]